MKSFFKSFLILFLLWLALSWQFSSFLLTLGVFFSALLALFQKHLSYNNIKIPLNPKLVTIYLPWLLWQVIVSAIYLTKKIWLLEIDVSTKRENFLIIDRKQKSAIASALFANSITLTPGSATLLLEDDKYYIHCLTKELKAGVFDIEKKVSQAFAPKEDFLHK